MFSDKVQIRYVNDLKDMAETETGKRVLAYLKDTYVNSSALDKNPELTYYRLGQKELIQGILNIIDNPKEVDDLATQISRNIEI